MKNAIIIVIIIILLILGFIFWGGKGEEAEAPVIDESQNNDTSATTPTAGETNVNVSVGTYQAPVKEFTVSGKNFAFTPSTITVNKGDRVKITFNNTGGFHAFVIDAYGVATKQAQSPATEILEFTADKAGSFEYYCSVGTHRQMGMKGTLNVI